MDILGVDLFWSVVSSCLLLEWCWFCLVWRVFDACCCAYMLMRQLIKLLFFHVSGRWKDIINYVDVWDHLLPILHYPTFSSEVIVTWAQVYGNTVCLMRRQKRQECILPVFVFSNKHREMDENLTSWIYIGFGWQ